MFHSCFIGNVCEFLDSRDIVAFSRVNKVVAYDAGMDKHIRRLRGILYKACMKITETVMTNAYLMASLQINPGIGIEGLMLQWAANALSPEDFAMVVQSRVSYLNAVGNKEAVAAELARARIGRAFRGGFNGLAQVSYFRAMFDFVTSSLFVWLEKFATLRRGRRPMCENLDNPVHLGCPEKALRWLMRTMCPRGSEDLYAVVFGACKGEMMRSGHMRVVCSNMGANLREVSELVGGVSTGEVAIEVPFLQPAFHLQTFFEAVLEAVVYRGVRVRLLRVDSGGERGKDLREFFWDYLGEGGEVGVACAKRLVGLRTFVSEEKMVHLKKGLMSGGEKRRLWGNESAGKRRRM